MKQTKKLTAVAVIIISTLSCSVLNKVRTTEEYVMVTVAEEASSNYQQITKEERGIVSPFQGLTMVDGISMYYWNSSTMIDVSPDGNHIAYIKERNGNNDVYLQSTKTGGAQTPRTRSGNVHSMRFSPDGEYIVYSDGASPSDRDLFMVRTEGGSAVRSVVQSSDLDLQPCFSVDGKKIFFVRNINSNNTLWSVELENSNQIQYGEGHAPYMMPNGRELLVSRTNKTTKKGEVWLIDLNKGVETLLVSDPEVTFSSATASPDGKKIACVGYSKKTSNRGRNLDVYILNIDGSGLNQITFHPGADMSPVWDETGNYIYFLSQRGNKHKAFNVWKVKVDDAIL